MNAKLIAQLIIRRVIAVTCLVLSIFLSQQAIAAPEQSPLEFWNVSNENNMDIIEHSPWQKILDAYLDDKHPSGINRFDYAAVLPQDKKALNVYLHQMQQLNPLKFNRAEQKAYWINIYNALTVELILEGFPVKSITKLGKGLFSFGPWDDNLAKIQGQDLSLNNIEHGILRPFFNDNRIHYAVNCASISCPNLSATVYTANNTDELLEQGAKQYINHPRGVSFDNRKLKVSSIYHWYKDDFGGDNKSLIEHFRHYAKTDLAKQLSNYQGDIEHDYDWNLNKP